MTIHDTPKRSVSMPKQGAKKVLPSGMRTSPPLPKAVNICWAVVSSGAFSDKENHWETGFPAHKPSEAMRVVAPPRTQACMTLSYYTGEIGRASGRERVGRYV